MFNLNSFQSVQGSECGQAGAVTYTSTICTVQYTVQYRGGGSSND